MHIFTYPKALYQKMGLVVSSESGVVEILNNTNWVSIAHGGQQGLMVTTTGESGAEGGRK